MSRIWAMPPGVNGPLITDYASEQMMLDALLDGNRLRRPLNAGEADSVMAYIRAYVRIHYLKLRLNPQYGDQWWKEYKARFGIGEKTLTIQVGTEDRGSFTVQMGTDNAS